MERFRPRRDTTTALDHIHHPEIHLSYQVVNAIVQEYQTGQSPMPEFLQANTSNLMVHLERIQSIDPHLASGFEHQKTRQLWEVVGYILERYLIHFPQGEQQEQVSSMLLRLTLPVNEQGEGLMDGPLMSMLGELHMHSRPDYLATLTEDQKRRFTESDQLLEPILRQCLSRYTTEGDAVLQAWIDSAGVPVDVLASMRRIERAQPGAITTLMQNFGVANYHRYPESVLLKQVERQPKPKPNYGIIMGARADHNSALVGTKQAIEHLANQVADDCDLVVVEFGTMSELNERLKVVGAQQPPTRQQAKFGLIMAHGNKDTIVGGRVRDGGDAYVTVADVGTILRQARQQYFTPDATWIISACETGQPGGIGEVIADDLDIATIAPPFQAGVEEITVSRSESGAYDFRVRYRDQGLFDRVNRFPRKGV